jgi:hypothetical protein
MTAKWAKEWLNTRWETRRGIWSTDYNNCLALLRASVEDVALAFRRRAARWERDALGAEIQTGEKALFVFRLRGHIWTEVLQSQDDYRWVASFSRRLGTEAIVYCVSDTTNSIGYDFYRAGRLQERFEYVGCQRHRLRSKVRRSLPQDVEDSRLWPDRFFREQDALDPFIDFDYFFNHRRPEAGERAIVQNPGHQLWHLPEPVVTRPGLERVDYSVLR